MCSPEVAGLGATSWRTIMKSVFATALMLMVGSVLAGACGGAEDPSPASVDQPQQQQEEVNASCVIAGACTLTAAECCTKHDKLNTRCSTTHSCCRPTGGTCGSGTAYLCCSGVCINHGDFFSCK